MDLALRTIPRRIERTFSGRYALLSVAVTSLAVNLILLGAIGIRRSNDTWRFEHGARHLIEGSEFQEKQASYSGYSALLAAIRIAGGGRPAVVVVHLLAALLAALALFDLGRSLAGPLAGAIATALFIFNADLARWHLYVMTDSLYISFVVFVVWLLFRSAERGGVWYAASVPVLIAAALLRPNGWSLLPVAAIFWIVRLRASRLAKTLVSLLVVVVFVAAAFQVDRFRDAIQAETPEAWLRHGIIVWRYDGWRIAMPQEPGGAEGWAEGIGYAVRHPIASGTVAAARIAAELAHVRPFYSLRHNTAVAVFLAPLYALAAIGFVRWRNHSLVRLIGAVMFVHLLTVALTFANWDGRFLLYVLPLIGIPAAAQASVMLRR